MYVVRTARRWVMLDYESKVVGGAEESYNGFRGLLTGKVGGVRMGKFRKWANWGRMRQYKIPPPIRIRRGDSTRRWLSDDERVDTFQVLGTFQHDLVATGG